MTKINNEKMAALLHASNLAFNKAFDLEHYLTTAWAQVPESTRQKWRKRAILFGEIIDMQVMEHG